jgi:hypothetical protein
MTWDAMLLVLLCVNCGIGTGVIMRALDRYRWQQWSQKMDREWFAYLYGLHRPTPDGMCLGCGKRHFNAVPMEFARRVAAIDRGEWP